MSEKRICFVCLESAKYRYCQVCKCYAHRKCAAKYGMNLIRRVCPQCRTKAVGKKVRGYFEKIRLNLWLKVNIVRLREAKKNDNITLQKEKEFIEKMTNNLIAQRSVITRPGFLQTKKIWLKNMDMLINDYGAENLRECRRQFAELI